MDLHALVPKLKSCFAKHPEILAVYAFGSVVKGQDHPRRDWDLSSDLDLAVLFHPRVGKNQQWDRRWKLYEELGQQMHGEIDLVVLNEAPLGLAHQILRTGRRVYERPNRRYRREEAELLMEALDFLPVQELIEARAIQRIKSVRG